MNSKAWILAITAVSLLTGAYTARAYFFQQPVPQEALETQTQWFDGPVDPTFEQLGELSDAVYEGNSPPSAFNFVEEGGRVSWVKTGMVLIGPPDEHQICVTVVDDTPAIDTAKLYCGSTLLFDATRANGSIIDRNGYAIATLPGLVPEVFPLSVRVVWTSFTGRSNEQVITIE